MLDRIFAKMGLSVRETQVYLALLEGAISAGNLSKKTGITRTTLYDILANLQNKGMALQSSLNQVKIWSAEPPERVLAMIEKETESWGDALSKFRNILPELKARESIDLIAPRFTYYEGIEGVRQVLTDMTFYRNIQTFAIWSPRDTVALIGPEFFAELTRTRIRQNISVKTIWPINKTVEVTEYPNFGVGPELLREARLAPPHVDISMSYWAYHNKVAFMSSNRECFGFIVESKEFQQMLKSQFDVMWEISSPTKNNTKLVKGFLKTI